MMIPPVVVLFVAATVNVTGIRKRFSLPATVVLDMVFALLIHHALPLPSMMAPFWGPLTFLAAQWHRLLPIPAAAKTTKTTTTMSSSTTSTTDFVLRNLRQGPLGPGASKLVEVLVAICLWRWVHSEWPGIRMGPMPNVTAWSALVVLSLVVNGVLYLWSHTTKSRGSHAGVHDMVRSTHGRSLTLVEHFHFAFLAGLNAICEEVTSRWFWWNEFEVYCEYPNLAQAVVFGIWHYHGIPSGWTGVALTFAYGWIMGAFKQYGNKGGLCLPICAHAIADYYLFTSIARDKAAAAVATSNEK